MPLSDERYVSLTTHRRDGTTSAVPVWIVDLGDGTLGFTTASSSLKAKRIRNDPRVELRPSDRKGVVADGAPVVTGTAEVVTGPGFERVREVVAREYGVQYRVIDLIGKVAKLVGKGSGTDAAVVVTPAAAEAPPTA